MSGTLFLVATPIGNLEDITYRAVRILGDVSVIACEDTRRTGVLLSRYGIHTKTVSYHQHNEAARSAQLLERLSQGEDIGLVSDAGTPLVSDPGYRLVRLAIDGGIPVVPVPGPSAILAALAASGLAAGEFHFGGFLPNKSSRRRKMLEGCRNLAATVVFYEAPHRILATLSDIEELLGERPIVVAREMTKVHEEFLRGTAAGLRRVLTARGEPLGEFTLLIAGAEGAAAPEPLDPDLLRADVEVAVAAGMSRMEAIKDLARRKGVPKRLVYQALERREDPL